MCAHSECLFHPQSYRKLNINMNNDNLPPRYQGVLVHCLLCEQICCLISKYPYTNVRLRYFYNVGKNILFLLQEIWIGVYAVTAKRFEFESRVSQEVWCLHVHLVLVWVSSGSLVSPYKPKICMIWTL